MMTVFALTMSSMMTSMTMNRNSDNRCLGSRIMQLHRDRMTAQMMMTPHSTRESGMEVRDALLLVAAVVLWASLGSCLCVKVGGEALTMDNVRHPSVV
jgi:hypothetical protein